MRHACVSLAALCLLWLLAATVSSPVRASVALTQQPGPAPVTRVYRVQRPRRAGAAGGLVRDKPTSKNDAASMRQRLVDAQDVPASQDDAAAPSDTVAPAGLQANVQDLSVVDASAPRGAPASDNADATSGPVVLAAPPPAAPPTPPPRSRHYAACVGVMSRPVTPRRAVVRDTWFAGHEHARLERAGVYARFVIGQPVASADLADPAAVEADLVAEAAAHGDIMRVPSAEAYDSLLLKVLAYYRTALAAVNASYYIKTDDDVYVRLDRVATAAGQWAADGAGYVGCLFLGGDMFADPASVYYEPAGALLPHRKYFGYMSGGFYGASAQAAAWIAARSDDQVRPMGCGDDCSIGLQMLGLPVRVVEDWRVCTYGCQATSVVVTDACNGLCDPMNMLPRLHGQANCTAGGAGEAAIGPLWAPANQRFIGKEETDAIGCRVLVDSQIRTSACRRDKAAEG